MNPLLRHGLGNCSVEWMRDKLRKIHIDMCAKAYALGKDGLFGQSYDFSTHKVECQHVSWWWYKHHQWSITKFAFGSGFSYTQCFLWAVSWSLFRWFGILSYCSYTIHSQESQTSLYDWLSWNCFPWCFREMLHDLFSWPSQERPTY